MLTLRHRSRGIWTHTQTPPPTHRLGHTYTHRSSPHTRLYHVWVIRPDALTPVVPPVLHGIWGGQTPSPHLGSCQADSDPRATGLSHPYGGWHALHGSLAHSGPQNPGNVGTSFQPGTRSQESPSPCPQRQEQVGGAGS